MLTHSGFASPRNPFPGSPGMTLKPTASFEASGCLARSNGNEPRAGTMRERTPGAASLPKQPFTAALPAHWARLPEPLAKLAHFLKGLDPTATSISRAMFGNGCSTTMTPSPIAERVPRAASPGIVGRSSKPKIGFGRQNAMDTPVPTPFRPRANECCEEEHSITRRAVCERPIGCTTPEAGDC